MSPRRHLAHLPSYWDNPIVFFTVCTHRRKAILASPDCHAILREIWERSAKLDGWWVGHYILLPDHVHFFARSEIDAKPIAKWVQTWKGISARRIIKALNARSPIWQADYFDRYLRSTESYSEKWDYIERNAVRAGIVQRAEDWPYRGIINDLML
jgi:REP element-mobilizing transposase RayT